MMSAQGKRLAVAQRAFGDRKARMLPDLEALVASITGELSWVAEGNLASVHTLEAAFGARVYKTYRVYERDL